MRTHWIGALSLAVGAASVQAVLSPAGFRRSIVSTNSSQITITDIAAPADWNTTAHEDHSQWRFRYLLIGCGEMHNTAFYDACCFPRPAQAQKDSSYPLACSLSAYQIFNPIHSSGQWTATLASAANVSAMLDDTEYAAVIPPAGFTTSSLANTWTSQAAALSSPKQVVSSSSNPSIPSPTQTFSVLPTHELASADVPSSTLNTPHTAATAAPYIAPAPPSSSIIDAAAAALFAPVDPVTSHAAANAVPTSTPATSAAPGSAAAPADSFNGQATYFYQGGNAGACGVYHSDNDDIVALKVDLYGWTGQKSQYCGRSLTITNTANGKTATAIVADACPGCSSYYSLDLSTGLFAKLGDMSSGVLPISWHWN